MSKKLFSITAKDLRVDFYRSSGPGGQNVNKRDTACRITHLESGAVGQAQDQRTQPANKKAALERMTKHPKFMPWVRIQASLIEEGYRNLDQKVDELMKPENLKIETFDDPKS